MTSWLLRYIHTTVVYHATISSFFCSPFLGSSIWLTSLIPFGNNLVPTILVYSTCNSILQDGTFILFLASHILFGNSFFFLIPQVTVFHTFYFINISRQENSIVLCNLIYKLSPLELLFPYSELAVAMVGSPIVVKSTIPPTSSTGEGLALPI